MSPLLACTYREGLVQRFPEPGLVLLALLVCAAHALLLDLLQGMHAWPVDGIASGSVVFQTRLLAQGPPQSALPAVAATLAQPAPEPKLRHIQHRPAPLPAAIRIAGIEHTPPDRDVVAAITGEAAQPERASMGALNAGTPESRSTARLPRPATITYQACVTQGAHSTALVGTLDWRHDGQSFDLRWRLFGVAAGDLARIATATGQITRQALMPVSVQDGPAALLPDTKVPLNALIEAGVLIAGNPSHYPVGSTIAVSDGAGVYPATTFIVADDDDFGGGGDYEGERLPALHLVHEPAGE